MEEADRVAAVAAVKALVRGGGAHEDALVGALVSEALDLAERFTGQVLIARGLTERIAADGIWRRLTATPVLAIAGVAEAGGAAMATSGYAVDIDANGDGWVRASSGARVVVVSLTAGLAADWSSLPGAISGGIVRLAAHRFDARGEDGAPPAAVSALWRPYRRLRLAERVRA